MARAVELKQMLINIRKTDTQTMDAYLRDMKTITDNLASINSPMSQIDLAHHNLMGVGREYETLVTTLTQLPLQLSFDDLPPRFLLHEQRLRFLDGDDSALSYPALAA